MRQKISIMKHKENPSDEEIQSYMNFDSLLEKRNITIRAARTKSFLKWGIPAFVVTVALVWFFLRQDYTPTVAATTSKTTDSVGGTKKTNLPSVPVDTSNAQNIARQKHAARVPSKPGAMSQQKEQKETSPSKQIIEPLTKESEYKQAEPVQGYPELYKFFNSNLIYPGAALKDSIQGIQTISFVINKEGKPEHIQVVNSLGEPFEMEAKRLVENMPAWKPATLNGKPVASKVSLPLTFQIQKIKE